MEDRVMRYADFEAIVNLLDTPKRVKLLVNNSNLTQGFMDLKRSFPDVKSWVERDLIQIYVLEEGFTKELLLAAHKDATIVRYPAGWPTLDMLLWSFTEGKPEDDKTYSQSQAVLYPQKSKIEIDYNGNVPEYLDVLLRTLPAIGVRTEIKGNFEKSEK